MLATRYPREGGRPARKARVKARRETGPERWARWAAMVEGGMTKAEVARAEGVSRAAVTIGIAKLSNNQSP